MRITKSFLTMWICQIIENKKILNDHRITGELVGKASSGDIEGLQELLVIYMDYIDLPTAHNSINVFPRQVDRKSHAILQIIPLQSRKQSIEDVLKLIKSNNFHIE